jgi:hypothetical protein
MGTSRATWERLAALVPVVLVASIVGSACSSQTSTPSVGTASTRANQQSGGGSSPKPLRKQHQHPRHHPKHAKPPRVTAAGVPAVDMPRPSLTPGVALAAGPTQICVPGYSSSVRDVPQAENDAVYARYGVAHVPYAHEVDHLISLELGGSNAIRNLWPEPYAGRWGARTKDVLENRLHDLVCAGQLSLHYAQHIEATNWPLAYRRYVGGTPRATPTSGGGSSSGGTPTSAGGFYASGYPTASTIYCADDPDWKSLSKTYLRHFATWAAAHRAFPTYHLHQPC